MMNMWVELKELQVFVHQCFSTCAKKFLALQDRMTKVEARAGDVARLQERVVLLEQQVMVPVNVSGTDNIYYPAGSFNRAYGTQACPTLPPPVLKTYERISAEERFRRRDLRTDPNGFESKPAVFPWGTRVRSVPALDHHRAETERTKAWNERTFTRSFGMVIPRPYFKPRRPGWVWVLCEDTVVRGGPVGNFRVCE